MAFIYKIMNYNRWPTSKKEYRVGSG
jgi:hypothetical protein